MNLRSSLFPSRQISKLAIFLVAISTVEAVALRDAAAGPEPAPSTASSSAAMSGATFEVRLRDIQARIDEQKDQTRRNRVRLALLSDSMPTAGNGNSTADLVFHNEVTSDFRLVRAVFQLDGTVRFDKSDDTGALAAEKDIPIFKGALLAGDHTLQALLVFRGNGFGVFTYLRGYKLEVKSSHAFTSSPNQPVTVIATGVQAGGATTPIQERLAVRWKVEVAPNPATVAAVSRIDPSDADASILAELRAALSPYGAWVDDATFGTIWVPSVAIVGRDFVPFMTAGHWTYEGVPGIDGDFAWISDYDWGWLPFHLGRWVFGSSGWSWIPGRTYAPSWVTWRIENESHGTQSHVGWAPTPPTFVWRGGAASRIDPVAPRFVYVPANEVFTTPLSSHVVAGTQSGAIESRTQIYSPAAGAVARAPSLASMGVSVAPVRTAIGETSLVRARDFSRRGTLAEVAPPTAVAKTSSTPNAVDASPTSSDAPSVAIDPADADPSVLSDVRSELAPYGTWTDDPSYGTVWVPSAQIVGANFMPYESGGHWTFDRSGGTDEGGDYVWMSDWSWGWAPFHYGRWVRGTAGWSWIPGRTYAPAWVVWRTGDGSVGWAPAPAAFCWKSGVAVRIDAPPPAQFVFVASGDVFAPNLPARVASPARAAELQARTTVWDAPSTSTGAQRVIHGPPPSRLGIRATVPRPPANDPGLSRARAGFVHVAAPPPAQVSVTTRPTVTPVVTVPANIRPATPPVTVTARPQHPSVPVRPTPSVQAQTPPVHGTEPRPQAPPAVSSSPRPPAAASSVRAAPTATIPPGRNRPRSPRR